MKTEREIKLEEAVARLTEQYQEVLFFGLQGLSAREISGLLRENPLAISVRIRNARNELKRLLRHV